MITCDPTTGYCQSCDRKVRDLVAVERRNAAGPVGLCQRCFDMAGDDNAVSDGHLACAVFFDRYGEHSNYCDCAAVAPAVDPAYTVVLTKSQMERVLLALWMPGHDLDEQDVAILTAMNTGTLIPA